MKLTTSTKKKTTKAKSVEQQIKEAKKELWLAKTKNDIAHELEFQVRSLKSEMKRSRSFSIGTRFDGSTEISMRTNDGELVWCSFQPVETLELINQLAANIGCHIKIVPRQDFGAWRDWRLTPEELAHYRGEQFAPAVGHAPHANNINLFNPIGADALNKANNESSKMTGTKGS